MLSLGRKEGEYIMIGDEIKVQVIKSDKGKLRLAIDCPGDMVITRGEVYEEREKARDQLQGQ